MYKVFSNRETVGSIPRYLKASSPYGLERLMLKTQIRLKSILKWKNIGQANDGKWYAWYVFDVDQDEYSKLNEQKKAE